MERDYEKQQLIQWLPAEMARAAGRSRFNLDALDKDSCGRCSATSTPSAGWPSSGPA